MFKEFDMKDMVDSKAEVSQVILQPASMLQDSRF